MSALVTICDDGGGSNVPDYAHMYAGQDYMTLGAAQTVGIIADTVPRRNRSIRPLARDTATGSEAIALGANCSTSDHSPSYVVCHNALLVPFTNTSRRPGPREHTPRARREGVNSREPLTIRPVRHCLPFLWLVTDEIGRLGHESSGLLSGWSGEDAAVLRAARGVAGVAVAPNTSRTTVGRRTQGHLGYRGSRVGSKGLRIYDWALIPEEHGRRC